MKGASIKEKVVWKVILENDLLSKVEISEDFPLGEDFSDFPIYL